MASQSMQYEYGQRTLPDYLQLASNVTYLIAGISFLVGLYFDWRIDVNVIIPQFVVAHDPRPNSGLFILSFLLLTVGYVISRIGVFIRKRRAETVDQTQEWTVDIEN
jgi:hypothetical protein